MGVEYDEKGKFYTEFISKDTIYSHIQMVENYVRGYIHVRKDERLSDEINKDISFLAVTKAEIRDPNGEILYTSDFLAVNRRHIVWLMPIDEQMKQPE